MDHTSRRTFLQLPVAAACAGVLPAGAATEPKPADLWYERPAAKWEEALAIGNGRLGAMIFGGVEKERLQLNEITIWSGQLEDKADRPEAYKGLPGIRQLIKEGKYPEANKAMLEQRTCQTGGRFGQGTYGSYQTLGDLNFEFAPAAGPVSGYRRWLRPRRSGGRSHLAHRRGHLDARAVFLRRRTRSSCCAFPALAKAR